MMLFVVTDVLSILKGAQHVSGSTSIRVNSVVGQEVVIGRIILAVTLPFLSVQTMSSSRLVENRSLGPSVDSNTSKARYARQLVVER